jgi:hypothetical protein
MLPTHCSKVQKGMKRGEFSEIVRLPFNGCIISRRITVTSSPTEHELLRWPEVGIGKEN